MRLNIGSLVGKEGDSFRVEQKISAKFVESSPDVQDVVSPILAQLTVTNTGNGYLVKGNLSLEVALQCSRCLKPMQTKLVIPVEEEYSNQYSPEQEEDPLRDELPLVEGTELDLTGLIEESVMMGIPMKPVCDPECPGLCSTCGVNLAEEQCDCLSPEIDVRLAPLSKLLETTESKSPERRKEDGSTKEKTVKGKNK